MCASSNLCLLFRGPNLDDVSTDLEKENTGWAEVLVKIELICCINLLPRDNNM